MQVDENMLNPNEYFTEATQKCVALDLPLKLIYGFS